MESRSTDWKSTLLGFQESGIEAYVSQTFASNKVTGPTETKFMWADICQGQLLPQPPLSEAQ